jgi:mannose-1-phosphate guanylyltransferase/phosphomannomutase
MKAVIMAGGRGTRLAPVTDDLPKPLVTVLDTPVINYSVRLLAEYGVTETAVTLCHMPERIIDSLNADFPQSDFYYFIEEAPLGTAGSVRAASDFLDETFLVISGDALTDINIEKLLSFHRARQADLTVAVKRVDDPSAYGAVYSDSLGRIFDFKEKSSDGGCPDTVSSGIYIAEPHVLKLIPQGTAFDFARDLFPLMLERGLKLYAYEFSEYWCDVGGIYSYFNANMDMLPAVTGGGGNFYGKDCFIGQGAVIGANTVIGARASVASGCELKNCIVLADTAVPAGVKASDCIIGRDFQIDLLDGKNTAEHSADNADTRARNGANEENGNIIAFRRLV